MSRISRSSSASCSSSRNGSSQANRAAAAPLEKFSLVSGESELVDYQFNKHVVHHLFCARCAVESFARGQMPDGTPMVAINVRCLDGVDISELTLTPFDGRSR